MSDHRHFTVGVMSDLHVGDKARACDFRPPGSRQDGERDYLERFISFINEQEIRLNALLLPGDLTNTAKPSEFDHASKLIERVREKCRIKQCNVFVVPGNHDANWHIASTPGASTNWSAKRYLPFLEARLAKKSRRLTEEPYFELLSTSDVYCLVYNSSWSDNHDADTHHGAVSAAQLSKIHERLKRTPPQGGAVRLCLTHHHPYLYASPDGSAYDFSAMQNADLLITLLKEFQFDALVHGHRHAPQFRVAMDDASHPLVVLGAGSFSAELESSWAGHVNNQFHAIEFDHSTGVGGPREGRVRSWAFLAGVGWVPSKSSHGIPHLQPFGEYLRPEHLDAALKEAIAALVGTKGHATWDDVVARQPRLGLVPERAIGGSLRRVCEPAAWEIIGELPRLIVFPTRQEKP